ncbi:hypothetical protein L6452_09422 [Arctium lappa]|uniref:Uncharacterized protein n=1 Tax=Arctium lappa TaxID=4217 RepID=A0ACB9DKM4_ARCLA|nr:hypothetical protein L6452_09422 [Arctium lappa]
MNLDRCVVLDRGGPRPVMSHGASPSGDRGRSVVTGAARSSFYRGRPGSRDRDLAVSRIHIYKFSVRCVPRSSTSVVVMTDRVLRSRAAPVERNVPADDIRNEIPRGPPGRPTTRGRGRGRGLARTTRKATTQLEGINTGNRGGANTRTNRRARSAEVIGDRESSHQESSVTVRGRGAARARGRGRNQAL